MSAASWNPEPRQLTLDAGVQGSRSSPLLGLKLSGNLRMPTERKESCHIKKKKQKKKKKKKFLLPSSLSSFDLICLSLSHKSDFIKPVLEDRSLIISQINEFAGGANAFWALTCFNLI